ncbi:MAG TPA: hypothetical protein VJV75_02750 [Candidatus Polarisedimenticolia bacterium]|nr:hypothetical protein [Candidatus Polarisedimenticolia bacterium]
MRPTHLLIATLALAGLSLACGDDDAEPVSVGPGVILTGTPKVTPRLQGSWVISSTPAFTGCGALNVLYEAQSVLTIAQVGGDIRFTLTDTCGRPIPGGEGTVDFNQIVELTAKTSRFLTTTCGLVIEQVRTGTVATPADQFSGSDVLTITPVDQPGLDDCDASLPCTVTGTFSATRCIRDVCAVACTP